MHLYTKLCVIAISGLLLASSVSSAAAADDAAWAMFKGDEQHTGQSTFNGSEHGTLRWNFPIGQRITSSPAIGADGTVYVGSYDGHLYAVNPDGTEKWRFGPLQIIDSSPAVAPDGTIYFGSWDKSLYAVAPDGMGRWRAESTDRISSSPTIAPDGTVYFGADNGVLYAVEPAGSLKWSFETGDRVFSSSAVAPDGTVYFGSFDGHLYAVNPDGTEKWRFQTEGFIFSSPSVAPDGTVYVGSYDSNLYAVNPDGTEKWRFETGGVVQVSPSIGQDGTVYFGSFDGHLYAVNPNGTEKWRFETADIVASSPVIDADGTLYFGSVDKNLYAVNPDGIEKWRFEANARIFSSPAIGPDGTVYVGSVDGNLYAIGEQLVRSESPFPVSGSLYESVGYAGTEFYVADLSEDISGGMKTISIDVVLKNNGVESRIYDPSSFKLIDLDSNEHEADLSRSDLKNVRIQSGDIIGGTLVFEIPSRVVADRLLYEDVKGVRLNVNLAGSKSPPDDPPGGIFRPGSNVNKKLIDDKIELTILDERFEPDTQAYVVRISITNISDKTVKYDQAYAYVKDAEGNVYTSTEGFFSGEVERGRSVTGEIPFKVPSSVESVIFVYDDSRSTFFVVPEFPLPLTLIMVSVSMSLMLLASRLRMR